MPMRVAVEGAALRTARPTGVGRYAAAIVRELSALEDVDVVVLSPVGPRRPGRLREQLHRVRFALRTWRDRSLDVALFPNFVRLPMLRRLPSVVVVYDVSFELHRDLAAGRTWTTLHRQVPESVRRATRVVTISEQAATEIAEQYGVEAETVSVVPAGVDATMFHERSEREVEAVTARYGIAGRYVLFVGTIEPRKSVEELLEAFSLLSPALRDEYALVIVGDSGWRDEPIKQSFDRVVGVRCVRTGYVPDDDLPALYSGAEAFVYPSVYEGFGLPPLEAMACGTPVIVTKGLPVVSEGDDVVQVVDVGDTHGLASAIEEVLTDPVRAATLRENGAEHARRFSWEASARLLRDVLLAAVAEAR